jgi:hypothetical protein
MSSFTAILPYMRASAHRYEYSRTSISCILVLTAAYRTRNNQLLSPLLRLPAELRHRIYELSYEGGALSILLSPSRKTGNPHTHKSTGAYALRSTCRQIRFESETIFYKRYVLDLRTYGRQLERLQEIPKLHNAEYIQNININTIDTCLIKIQVRDDSLRETTRAICLHGILPNLARVTIDNELNLKLSFSIPCFPAFLLSCFPASLSGSLSVDRNLRLHMS